MIVLNYCLKLGDEMKRSEEKQFFNKVKGKKIKWSNWGNTYFIPKTLNKGVMTGLFNGKTLISCRVDNGFKSGDFGDKWELVRFKITLLPFIYTLIYPFVAGSIKPFNSFHNDWLYMKERFRR